MGCNVCWLNIGSLLGFSEPKFLISDITLKKEISFISPVYGLVGLSGYVIK
jgi:hypothetical protein